MNFKKIMEILDKQSPSQTLNAFVKGAARTEAVIVTANPKALRDVLPNHRLVPLEQLNLLPQDANVLFAPDALQALVIMLARSSVSIMARDEEKMLTPVTLHTDG